MYFKRLEIVGFKSFYNKTTLDFEPGVTAVVGPNGCGKSNIFDSIRWVLGEQSVKALRGSQMEDVIFNGTETKESLSMAEVTLTFDNEQKHFPVDHKEIAITRRIFRSGESEYLLNKSPVRLKDILDLLLGTGIGAESYSLVQQGKIDLILSSRPEDRRLVFDEAAGITKYKSQKKETIRKLEETEQNLLRVNDIITEVKRQIGSLERQANKARKYKEVFEELKYKEINLAVLQKKSLQQEKDELIGQLTELESEESKFLSAIVEQEAGLNQHQAEVKVTEEKIAQIKNQILTLDNLIARNQERIQYNHDTIAESERTKQYLAAQITQLQNRLAADEQQRETLRKQVAAMKETITFKYASLQEYESQLNELTGLIKKSLDTIASAKTTILDLTTRIAHVKNEITDSSAQQQVFLSRAKRLDIEKAKSIEEKSAIEASLAGINAEVLQLTSEFDALTGRLASLKGSRETEQVHLNDLTSEIERLEKQKLTLESQKQFIEQLRIQYDDIGESMNATIYLDKKPDDAISGLVIKLKTGAEAVPAEPPSFKFSGEAKPIDLDLKKITERLLDIEQKILAFKNAKAAKVTAIEDLNKTILETQELCRHHEMMLVNKQALNQNILEQFNKIKDEEEIISVELSEIQSELVNIASKTTQLQSGLSDLSARQQEADSLINKEQNSVGQNSQLKEEKRVEITRIKTEAEALSTKLHSDEAALKLVEDTYLQDKNNLASFEQEIQDSSSKEEILKQEIRELESAIVQTRQQLGTEKAGLIETQSSYQQMLTFTLELAKKIESDRKALEVLKKRLQELYLKNQETDFRYTTLKDRILQTYKLDIDTVADTSSPMRHEEQPSQVPAADETSLSIPDDREIAELLTQEILKLKEKLDAYGSVNLVAIEEYDELKKRYDFLTRQQTDLATAKQSLHDAILKINRTTKKMFMETFERVREEFRNHFKLLFNGGDAQIYLIDEQDPLESGIEIICRPPGKKLQNVLLLSGGEKSMSAIALIFAIFKVKPAPFCVLDEIDAALDEANVDRYGRILQDFAHISQFIVITHNKRTIANADVMYGITMEEAGISKIVSVKFAQKKSVQDNEPDMTAVPA